MWLHNKLEKKIPLPTHKHKNLDYKQRGYLIVTHVPIIMTSQSKEVIPFDTHYNISFQPIPIQSICSRICIVRQIRKKYIWHVNTQLTFSYPTWAPCCYAPPVTIN